MGREAEVAVLCTRASLRRLSVAVGVTIVKRKKANYRHFLWVCDLRSHSLPHTFSRLRRDFSGSIETNCSSLPTSWEPISTHYPASARKFSNSDLSRLRPNWLLGQQNSECGRSDKSMTLPAATAAATIQKLRVRSEILLFIHFPPRLARQASLAPFLQSPSQAYA